MFNVVIVGGEHTGNYEKFQEWCIFYLRSKAESGERIRIFTTGDKFVKQFAERFGINTKTFSCNWEIYGKEAYKYRNNEILKEANAIIYFDTNKKDLNALFKYAMSKNIPGKVIRIDEKK